MVKGVVMLWITKWYDPSLQWKGMQKGSPVKMFLSGRQAGYSNRQQGPKNLEICGVLESDKCEVSGRYFIVGGQIASCWHILTGLKRAMIRIIIYYLL